MLCVRHISKWKTVRQTVPSRWWFIWGKAAESCNITHNYEWLMFWCDCGMTSGITVPQKKKIIPAVSIWHSEKQSPAPHFYVLFFSSFQWFLAISCPTSRAHAGTRSSPVILARIRTRTTASVSAPRVSRTCVTTWEPDSTRMCATSTGNTFACAACRTFTSSDSQSVARQTCFTDSWCFQSLNLTP